MPRRRTLLMSIATLSVVGLSEKASAQPQSALPAEVAAAIPGAVALGTARMRFFGLDIYDARLWVAPDFQADRYAQYTLALELTYLRSLSGPAIAQRSVQEMRRSASITADQETRWLAAMQAAFADVRAGDRITGVHTPSVGARFWLNGQARAPIADAEFSRLFFGIWLAGTTSEPAMRTALLARPAP